ncbi:MAG TPA: OmpH family outer membrane protein [Adhaeribacter sp.]|nr:OmpH family outer membrane protein [Adhaeribacter sp.]
MKKYFLILTFPLTVGAAAFLTSCDPKPKTTDTAEVKTPASTDSAQIATTTPDTTATALTETTTETETTPVAPVTEQVAEKPKFGYINSADLIQVMPETKRAEANLSAYVKNLETQFGKLQTDYQNKITDFQANERTMVDAIKQTKIQALQELEQKMQESQVSAQQKVAAKREELFKPILDKAEKAIKQVGKENNYDYIFDENAGTFIYAKDSHNVMPLVKAKLGLR